MSDEERSAMQQHPHDDHPNRVDSGFSEFESGVEPRVTEAERERLRRLREATRGRDRAATEKHLEETKAESNWLYEELMKHPTISAIFRELAIFGL